MVVPIPIRKFFGRSAETAAQKNMTALPAQQARNDDADQLTRTLREEFKDAVYGNRFRTLAYFNALDDPATADKEWLEAFKMPGQGWKVKCAIFHHGEITGEPAVNYKTLRGEFTFLEAVEKLAAYEETNKTLNKEACDKPSSDELGYSHVRAFAEREGIAFDLSGQPHPTKAGIIVSDGWFPENAQEKVEEAYQHTKEIHTLPIQDLTKALLPDVQTDDAAKLQSAREIAEAVSQITDKLVWANHQLDHMSIHRFGEFASLAKNNYHIEHNKEEKAARFLLHKSADIYKDNEMLASLLHVPVNLYGFYLCSAMVALGHFHGKKNDAIEKCAIDKLAMTGIAREDAKIIAEKVTASNLRYIEQDIKQKCFEPIEAITKYFTDVRDYYEQMQGIHARPEVKELPSQEKLVQQLAGVPVPAEQQEEQPEGIVETKELVSWDITTPEGQADAIIKRFRERHREDLSPKHSDKKELQKHIKQANLGPYVEM